MKPLSPYLSEITVSLNVLLLDPNNPRFAELGTEHKEIPENRYDEPKIQKEAFEKMKRPEFEVSELRETIKTLGFLPMDRIVVRKWNGDSAESKFLVIEGNRRITALKWLKDMHDSGKESLSEDELQSIIKVKALLLDEKNAPDIARFILPGLRHVSGIKQWGPFQKASAVFSLREKGFSPQDVAQSLGLHVREANKLWRSYLALKQMESDEEFGSFAVPRKYSYFEEVFKKATVREWLGWDDNQRKFTNDSNLREFYCWMIGEPNSEGELEEPKLPEALSVRELSTILKDESAMKILRSSGGSLRKALANFDSRHPEDWRPIIQNAQQALEKLTPSALRELSDSDIELIKNLIKQSNQTLDDIQKLTK